MKSGGLYWKVDYDIRAPEVRVIGADGIQIGIMKTSEAIKKAHEKNLSLVEVAPLAKPPVAKIVDYGKFKYQEEKKARREQRGIKGGEIKEIRFSPFIAEKDFNTRLARTKEFLAEKNKVRIVIVFRKPQESKKDFGYNLLKRIVSELGTDNVSMDMEPKFLGRNLVMIISPISGKKNA